MKRFWTILARYKFFFILLAINMILLASTPKIGLSALQLTKANLLEMLSILPPIFILLGLIDVWVKRETMIKFMGKGSGAKGLLIAFIMGSAAAGPLYAAFPVAGMLTKKGATMTNVFVFVGAWSTTKIPMLLFEAANLGWKFTLLRLACSIVGILLIAVIMERTTTEDEKQAFYEKVDAL